MRKRHLSHWLGPLWAPSGFPQGSCLTRSGAAPAHPFLSGLLHVLWRLFLAWLCWVFLAVGAFLELRCTGFSLRWLLWLQSTGSRALGCQQLWRVGSVLVAPGLQGTGSVVVAHGLGSSVACGIFPEQGSNPHLLHWQADSFPLSHPGGPIGSSWLTLSSQPQSQLLG